ncbi:hypothetical protein [Phaffia rhodozyma]|uniref:Uncharacterized protein n=1 Tax=Phaffia rhodozyma TaxID=264483 RepID=A0A0F7SUE9_PHARH|nr:hypothetical protein [Phaffia rhodozyma]
MASTSNTVPPAYSADRPIATESPALTRTVSKATSTFEEFKANTKREPFVLKRRPRASDNMPTESVLDFKRDEYFLQRPIYIASYVAGWMVGSPELGIHAIKNVEKGVQKVTGIAPDPVGRRRQAKADKNRLAARAELDALEEFANEDAQSVRTQQTAATGATEVRPLMGQH